MGGDHEETMGAGVGGDYEGTVGMGGDHGGPLAVGGDHEGTYGCV